MSSFEHNLNRFNAFLGRDNIEQRRAELDIINAQAGDSHVVTGAIRLKGLGDQVVAVKFPVRFIEHPAGSFMGELEDNQRFAAGSFPKVHAVIWKWDFVVRDHTGDRLYDGASLAISVEGSYADTAVILNYTFIGRALTNPSGTFHAS